MTQEQLGKCMPLASSENIAKYLSPLNMTMDRYEINTPQRQAAFLAQIGHESASLSLVEENLNYSKAGLLKIFPKYFTKELAEKYARNPKAIASRVYANRMGNGTEESGDGWTYRGKGLIQLTGKDNHELFGVASNYDFVSDPDALMKPGAASLSSGWFWFLRDLNTLADVGNFERITKRINGGLNGYQDRLNRWAQCKQALGI